MLDAHDFWEPYDPRDPDYSLPPAPPKTADEIREWEVKHSVRLPALLADALTIQDGGQVSDTRSLVILPLEEMDSLAGDQWGHVYVEGGNDTLDLVEAEKEKLILIGDVSGCGIVLDYRDGPEPRIRFLEYDMGGRISINTDHGTFAASWGIRANDPQAA